MKRYAIVRRNGIDPETVRAYLPGNYRVIGHINDEVVIQGEDRSGFTLDGYVIPRLGSGLMGCEEVDLSHPIMSHIDDTV